MHHSNSHAVRNLRARTRVPRAAAHICERVDRDEMKKEKKRETEKMRRGGIYRWFSSWCFSPGRQLDVAAKQGEEGKDVHAWREREDEKTREE